MQDFGAETPVTPQPDESVTAPVELVAPDAVLSDATIEPHVQDIQKRLATHFVFRKLGLCYDYAAEPNSFPRPTLPDSKDVRDGTPNENGFGTGMAHSTRNGGLLFDGYLLRLELGISGSGEERVFDRLIGGMIRTATTAPKGFLPRGLTPDGRGFYPRTNIDAHLGWAFSAWRGFRTAAIALESQEKLSNIASKWIARLERDQWMLSAVNGKATEAFSLRAMEWDTGPKCLALLAVAADLTDNGKWRTLYEELFTENDSTRLSLPLPEAEAMPTPFLQVQLALHILHALEEKEERKALLAKRMRAVAERVVPFLNRFEQLRTPILEETPDLDWKALEKGTLAAEDDHTSGVLPTLPVAWRRLTHEAETVQVSMEAALTLMLAGDAELVEPHVPLLERCFCTVPWDTLWLADAMIPALVAHIRGVELGVWDAALLQIPPSITGETIINIQQYMAPEYDEAHPNRAGHTEPPPSKQKLPAPDKDEPESGKKKPRRRRRRRRR